jgi:hypothetical protein
MATKYNRRRQRRQTRKSRKRGGGFLYPENEQTLNERFTEAPTLKELDEFRIKNMPYENYSEILGFILKKFNIQSLPKKLEDKRSIFS